jgi:uncharacterized protein with HEPN domain
LKDELVYVRHIKDEITFLNTITRGRGPDDLVQDDYFSHAVRSALEIIGEAAKNVPEQVKQESPDIPWRDMAALRDRIIHGYFSIDYSIVWNVITTDLPAIEPGITSLLERKDPNRLDTDIPDRK